MHLRPTGSRRKRYEVEEHEGQKRTNKGGKKDKQTSSAANAGQVSAANLKTLLSLAAAKKNSACAGNTGDNNLEPPFEKNEEAFQFIYRSLMGESLDQRDEHFPTSYMEFTESIIDSCN